MFYVIELKLSGNINMIITFDNDQKYCITIQYKRSFIDVIVDVDYNMVIKYSIL